MANKAASLLSILLLIAFGLELVAVLSVPITKKIKLCSFGDYEFGVFGYCNVKTGVCSGARIGYPTNGDIKLPSSARATLSKLLIVHVVAAGLALVMFICALLAHVLSNSTGFLLVMLVLALPTFLISLLAFLVDILLFVSYLSWAGWIVLASTILIAISCIVLCLMRRTISSQRAMNRQLTDNSELQSLGFNNPNAFSAGLGTFGHVQKAPEFAEIKYEPSEADVSEDKVPLRNIGSRRSEDNLLGDVSYVTDDGNMNATADLINNHRGVENSSPLESDGYHNMPGSAGQRRKNRPRGPGNTVVAGEYVPGLENERAAGYGAKVVPVPRVRPESPVSRPFNRRPSGPRVLPGNDGFQTPAQYNSVPEPAANTGEYVPPRSEWQKLGPNPVDFEPTAYSGASGAGEEAATKNNFAADNAGQEEHQQLRNYFTDQDSYRNQPTGYSGPARAVSTEIPPSPYEQNPASPSSFYGGYRSPSSSPVNSTIGPQSRSNRPTPHGTSSYYGPPMRGYAAPSVPPPPKNLSDGILESNPDFQINVRKKPGQRKAPGIPRTTDSAYGFR